jgi:hypothetical protein
MGAWPAKSHSKKLADSCAISDRSWPPLAASGIRAGDGRKHIAAETLNALCFFNAVWWWLEDQTSTFLIAHEL